MWPFKKDDPTKPRRCSTTIPTGLFWGYRCELQRGHTEPHQVTTSRTTRCGQVIGSTVLEMPLKKQPRDEGRHE